MLETILDRCLDYRNANETISSVVVSSVVEALAEKLGTLPPKVMELCAEIVLVLLPKVTPVKGTYAHSDPLVDQTTHR